MTAAPPTVAVDAKPGSGDRAGGTLRTDIQGLRALAVALVLVYHLFPQRLTGGFVGVDAFFVISGFLITAHLLARPPRGARDLALFWSRRVRRLLPASLLVLASSLVAARLVAPETQWENIARQTGGATLYVVNWLLASDSVDYLAAENAPTPVQHFWSLSVEEQFYFGWPLLILVLVALAARRGGGPSTAVRTVLAGLAAVVLGSFAWSVHATATNPAAAYFVTPTRIWELGVGGLLAVWLSRRALGRDRTTEAAPLPAPVRAVLAWAGLAAVLVAGWSYTAATPFPGWQAALPVLGTAAVIAAHPVAGERGTPGRLLAHRGVQWLGDVSYSVYLWHWPLVVLVPHVSGGRLGVLDKAAILLATLVLAALTKRHVEDRFRDARWERPLAKPFLLAVAGMAVVLGLVAAQLVEVRHRESTAEEQLQRALAGDADCFGAAALTDPACEPATGSGPVVPAPAQAARDKSAAYSDVNGGTDCWSSLPDYPTTTCTFGDPDGTVSVALVGNSHAGHWLPALEEVAEARGWRITTYLASRCAMATTVQQFATDAQAASCGRWVDRTAREVVADGADLVVYSNRMSFPAAGETFRTSGPAYAAGYADVLEVWREAGVPVLGIRDTPAPLEPVPDCVALHEDDLAACAGRRAEWLPQEPLLEAAQGFGPEEVVVVDPVDRICDGETCPAVVGGVVVYFDGSHLTATYARTLAPLLAEPLERLLARAG